MNIRPILDKDRQIIADIHARSWQENYRDVLSDEFLDTQICDLMLKRWATAKIRTKDIVLVAEDESLVGFVAIWDDETVYIDNLHVRGDYQSRGIGRKLLIAAAKQAKANGRISACLDVVVGNERARKFYLALGGVPNGIDDKDIYGNMIPNERIIWPDINILIDN